MPSLLRPSLLALATALGIAPAEIAAAEPSSIDAVRAELAPDGQLYAYVDFERGWARIGEEIDVALTGVTEKPVHIAGLLDSLGLTDIRALGMSSKAVPGGYDNRIFLHMPGGRRGLFSIFPGEPGPFTGLAFAPADTDLFVEVRVDVGALFAVFVSAVDGVVSDADALAGFHTALDAIDGPARAALQFRGTAVIAVRIDDETGSEAETDDEGDFFMRIDTLGQALLALMENDETVERIEHPKLTVFKTAAGDLAAFDGEVAMLASDLDFLEECRTRTKGLDQVPEVRALLAGTSAVGHSLVYTSPDLIESFRKKTGLAALLKYDSLGVLSATHRDAITQALASIPQASAPGASVLIARPDGILVREVSTTSSKSALPIVAALTPDFLGEFAVQAVRAVSVFTASSRAREVVLKQLGPDLETIAAAARVYFENHDEAGSVTLAALREQPGGDALPDLSSQLEGELEIARRSDEVILQHREHGEMRHVIPLTAEQRAAIEANLRLFDAAASRYLVRENTTSVYGGFVLSSEPETILEPVVGEDYSAVSFDEAFPVMSVTTPGGQDVSIEHDAALVTQARRRLAEQRYAIEQALARLDAAALAWLESHPESGAVDSTTLFMDGTVTAPEPIAGEDYQNLYFSKSSPDLFVESPTLGSITYTRPLDAGLESAVQEKLARIAGLAATWFKAHPEAVLVLAAELAPADDLALLGAEGDAIDTDPALSALVILRTAKKLSVTLEGGHVVDVPLQR